MTLTFPFIILPRTIIKSNVYMLYKIEFTEKTCYLMATWSDSPVLQGFSSRSYDFSAMVAECLTFFGCTCCVTSRIGLSKLVCTSDRQELIHLFSEDRSNDVHRILFASYSILYLGCWWFVILYLHLVFYLACYMAVVVAGYAFYRVIFPLLMEFETLNEWKYGLSKKRPLGPD